MNKYEIREEGRNSYVTETIEGLKPVVIASFIGYGLYGNGKADAELFIAAKQAREGVMWQGKGCKKLFRSGTHVTDI